MLSEGRLFLSTTQSHSKGIVLVILLFHINRRLVRVLHCVKSVLGIILEGIKRVLGSTITIFASKIHKLQPRSSPCVFLGYPSSHRGYKWYDLTSNKIIIYRHVVFDETNFSFSKASKSTPHEYSFSDDPLPVILVQHSASQSPSPMSQSTGPLTIPGPNPAPSSPLPHLPLTYWIRPKPNPHTSTQ